MSNRVVKYKCKKGYMGNHFYDTEDFADAVMVANAAALHTGSVVYISRDVNVNDNNVYTGKSQDLMQVHPSSVDFRKATPEWALLIQTLAQELATGIETLVAPDRETGEPDPPC